MANYDARDAKMISVLSCAKEDKYTCTFATQLADNCDIIPLATSGDIDFSGNGGGPSDIVPPVISIFSPSPNSTITNTDSISFSITDDIIGPISIWVTYSDNSSELIANNAAFTSKFSTSTAIPAAPSGYDYVLSKDDGWTDSLITINATAVDSSGNVATASESYIVSDPIINDITPPVIGPFNPESNSTILANDSIVINIFDDSVFGSVTIWSVFNNGSTELIASNDVFEPRYSTSSIVGTWPSVFIYNILRDDGWLTDTFTLYIKAIDAAGNISTSSSNYNVSNPTAVATHYLMRGRDANCPVLTYRVWEVTESPDYIGSQYTDEYCGESLNLTDIVMIRSWQS